MSHTEVNIQDLIDVCVAQNVPFSHGWGVERLKAALSAAGILGYGAGGVLSITYRGA